MQYPQATLRDCKQSDHSPAVCTERAVEIWHTCIQGVQWKYNMHALRKYNGHMACMHAFRKCNGHCSNVCTGSAVDMQHACIYEAQGSVESSQRAGVRSEHRLHRQRQHWTSHTSHVSSPGPVLPGHGGAKVLWVSVHGFAYQCAIHVH